MTPTWSATTPRHFGVRGALLSLVVLAAVAGSVATQWLVWTVKPDAAVLVCIGVAAFAIVGLLLWFEGDQQENAMLMWLAGGLFMLDKAYTWPTGPLIMIGQWFGWLYAITQGVVLLRYPAARLSPAHRRVVWAIVSVLVICRSVAVLTSRRVDLISALPRSNSVWWPLVFASPRISSLAQSLWLSAAAVSVLVFVVLTRRRLREIRPLTRDELVMVWPALLAVASALLLRIIVLAFIPPSMAEESFSDITQSVATLVIPLVFIVGALRRRMSRARVGDLVMALRPPVNQARIREVLREALDDPWLDVYYRATPQGEVPEPSGAHTSTDYANDRGQSAPAEAHLGRSLVSVSDRGGKPDALVDLDSQTLKRHRKLVDAALAAGLIAFANAQLEVALRQQLDAVSASRARITEAGVAERRRLERDLHDGVQQRLLTIGAILGRLSLQPVTADVQQLIEQARDSLRDARTELSSVARGLHPAILTQVGLRGAIQSVAEHLPITVRVDIPDYRWPPQTEATAYFVVCEALTNIVKHADTQRAHVSVSKQAATLTIRIIDHGRGGALRLPGRGLAGICDRVAALGGQLFVAATTKRGGTTVTAVLPCE